MRHLLTLFAAAAVFATAGFAAPPPTDPPIVRVRLDTSAGPILLALDARHAPKTVNDFMNYVDDGRLDGTQFYRASRAKGNPKRGFVQGGVGTDARRTLPPVPLEPTSVTGLSHVDGAISMAHGANPNTGDCNFSLLVGANPSMNAHGRDKGYAVFGKVIGGMNVVKTMLAMPTGGGTGPMKGQMLLHPIKIIHAVRLNGTPHPTGRPKPWLIFEH